MLLELKDSSPGMFSTRTILRAHKSSQVDFKIQIVSHLSHITLICDDEVMVVNGSYNK